MANGEAQDTAETTPPATGTLARLGQLAWQALPAVASALGLAGFVALIGGAIEWIRFWSAGLPADQAVRAVSNQELVTIGAVSLIAFTITGMLAVLVVYLLDREGDLTLPTLRGLLALAVVEMLIVLIFVDVDPGWYLVIAAWLIGLGVLAGRVLAEVPERLLGRDERKDADDDLRKALRAYHEAEDNFDDASFAANQVAAGDDGPGGGDPDSQIEIAERAEFDRDLARHRWERVLARWVAQEQSNSVVRGAVGAFSGKEPPSEAKLEAQLTAKPTRPPGRWRAFVRQTFWLIAALVAGTVLLWGFNDTRWLAAMLIVVVLLAVALFGVARATTKFAWYGVAVFFSVLLFGSALNIARTIRSPKVQPVALVRKSDDKALCGVYITETDKRVYLGHVEPDGKKARQGVGRVFWVPSDDIDVVSVGPLQGIKSAEKRATAMTLELYADRAQAAGAVAKPTTTTVQGPSPKDPGKTVTETSEMPSYPEPPSTRPGAPKPKACATRLP